SVPTSFMANLAQADGGFFGIVHAFLEIVERVLEPLQLLGAGTVRLGLIHCGLDPVIFGAFGRLAFSKVRKNAVHSCIIYHVGAFGNALGKAYARWSRGCRPDPRCSMPSRHWNGPRQGRTEFRLAEPRQRSSNIWGRYWLRNAAHPLYEGRPMKQNH